MLKNFRKFLRNDEASAAVEAGLLFPVLVLILCGTVDMGVGLIMNLKVINACQTIGDLLTRSSTVSAADITDAVAAGQLSILPYDTTSYGSDIASIEFLNTALTPTVVWRDTRNMVANTSMLAKSAGLGGQNEGVIAVTVTYIYHPYFTGIVGNTISMSEEAYVRPRKGGYVMKV